MGERRLKLTKLHEETGISRNTLTSIYYDRTKMIKFKNIKLLCDYFQIPIQELFEYNPKGRDANA